MLRQGNLPLPVPQYWVETRSGPKRVDFAYPEHRLALELDSFAFHGGGRKRFDDDRARFIELRDAGWDLRPITWTMLTGDPLAVLWTVGTGLGLAPYRWRAGKR